MRKDGKYRFTLQFSADSEDQIRVGELLENLGNRKSTIIVSALNTLEISCLEAPILLKIPISFVLSRTDMYVMVPIIIDETTSEIDTKAISP